ncbi:hypothetical protein ZIOFF_071315 [Zingiber officinale]|uniref:Protein kinase domain-containing protein n=1 Tax=Zingiber officinale TaxID=94328 RepID=A0A8J5ETI4_ZINOF|nr:hypothetical protein ZIOFF_071315 [Zingiber officinale]
MNSRLSGRNLTGNIPAELASLTGLVELWLDGNVLCGHIPALGACLSLRNIHLENNKLTGDLSFLDGLSNLQELYVQNNMLSGTVPGHLLGKNIVFTRIPKKLRLFSREDDLPPPQPFQELSASFGGFGIETAHRYWLSEINDATENFAKKVGSGGYGTVYYGKLKNGKEIAVKVQTNDSCQGNRQFSSEGKDNDPVPRKEKKREARREEKPEKAAVIDMVFRRCTGCLEDARVEKT